MNELSGKVAFVTGGARDIGGQTSLKLAQAGAKVCLNYFGSGPAAEATVRAIEAAGGTAMAVRGDLTDERDVAANVRACQERFGSRIDFLVNVAGGLVARKTLAEMDGAFWDRVLALNLKTAFLAARAVAPHLPTGGVIVNIASQAGRDGGGAGATAYAAAKGAMLTFTRSLAKELGPRGIRVNAVAPGMISTTFHDTFTSPEVRQRVAAGTPLRREGKAGEVADLVVYLCSDRSTFITGAAIDINGGALFS